MLMWFRKFLPVAAFACCLVRGASVDPAVAGADSIERPVAQDTARLDSRTTKGERRVAVATMRTAAPRPEDSPRPESRDVSQAREMLQTLDRSAYCVNTVTARMNVTIKRGTAKAMSLDGVYVGDANGNLRLRLTGLFGMLAMDVTVKDGTLTCWMPTKKLLVQATREELLIDGNSELAVLAAVGQARELFFPRPWADGATQRRLYANDSDMRIGVFGGASGRACLRDYSIDRSENAIRSLDMLTEHGEVIGRIDYGQYQALTKVDKTDDKDSEWRASFKVPRSIKLADGQARMTLECTVDSLKVNEPLKSGAFDMELPKGVTAQKAHALEEMAKEMTGAVAKAD